MIDKRFEAIIIETAVVRDIRFRFFEGGPGSDANNPHTDYSNAYLKVTATGGAIGVGIGFALGKGNEHICLAVKELFPIIQGASLFAILSNFKVYWRKLANPFQSRWIGPNCGPYYMAAGVIANAVFDLWAKLENKPLWEAASELEPDDIISLIDFRYVEHIITPAEARSYYPPPMPAGDSEGQSSKPLVYPAISQLGWERLSPSFSIRFKRFVRKPESEISSSKWGETWRPTSAGWRPLERNSATPYVSTSMPTRYGLPFRRLPGWNNWHSSALSGSRSQRPQTASMGTVMCVNGSNGLECTLSRGRTVQTPTSLRSSSVPKLSTGFR